MFSISVVSVPSDVGRAARTLRWHCPDARLEDPSWGSVTVTEEHVSMSERRLPATAVLPEFLQSEGVAAIPEHPACRPDFHGLLRRSTCPHV